MDPEQLQQGMPQGLPSAVPPAPEGGMPGMGGEEMATPEQKQQLMDLIEATRGKVGDLNTALFQSENAADAARRGALKEVFTLLEAAGVDLNDPESVSNFLNNMKMEDPELAAQLEEAISGLLGEEPQPTEELTGEMNVADETLPQDIRGLPPTQEVLPG